MSSSSSPPVSTSPSPPVTLINGLHPPVDPARELRLEEDYPASQPITPAGWTPLQIAIRLGFSDIITLLLAHSNIDVNEAGARETILNSALVAAAHFGHLDITTPLLAHPNIEVNQVGLNGARPLHVAPTPDSSLPIPTLTSTE